VYGAAAAVRAVSQCRVAAVRPADRERDDAEILRLWCELIAYHKSVERVRPRRWQGAPEDWLRRVLDDVWADPRRSLLVAEEGGRTVGFAQVRLDDDGPCSGRVETLVVDPAARGVGVGKLLMEAAEAWLRAHGADEVAIEVIEPNTGARRFYESLGYRPLLVTYIRTIDELCASEHAGRTEP
jgi:ribosomal protein S18 acetylase RimI-like enzyme